VPITHKDKEGLRRCDRKKNVKSKAANLAQFLHLHYPKKVNREPDSHISVSLFNFFVHKACWYADLDICMRSTNAGARSSELSVESAWC